MLAAIAAVATSSPSVAAELNTLKDVRVQRTPAGAQVVVDGSRAPTFTVFRLSEPDRLVVDVSSADAAGIRGHHEGAGPVSGVVASQFSDERQSVARVLVALDKASQYDVRADGNRVVIRVDGVGEKAAASAAPEKAVKAQPVAAAAEPAPPAAPKAESAPKAENVVATELDERQVRHPATRITALRFSRDRLSVDTDGEVAKYELIELDDPPRLAFDVYGVALTARAPKARSARVREVRAAPHEGRVRVVVEMAGKMPAYKVGRHPRGLSVTLSSPVAPNVAQVAAVSEVEIDGKRVQLDETEPVPVAAVPAPERRAPERRVEKVEIRDVAFHESAQGGKIELKLTGATPWKVERPDPASAVLTLDRASLPRRLERSLDTSALDTPVRMISTFSVPNSDQVRVVVAAQGAFEERATESKDGLTWQLTAKRATVEELTSEPKTAGFSSEAPAYAAQGAPRARYTGKKVSFEFKDIDIHNLLRIIAEVSKKNVVVADDVQGKVTIRLRNVPWDQALELILRSKGLGKESIGNIIRVAPLKQLEEEAKLRAERAKANTAQENLAVQLIPVNYATAGEMAPRVKEVLSERGNVAVDTRTNVLIVRDIASNINKARQLVQNLDTQTPQVLIESRIVEASTSFSRQVGIQWGGSAQAAPGTGNPTGLVFPNTVSVAGGSSNEGTAGTADTPNFAVNLPAAVGTGSGGALGFIFGSAGGALALNLRLSALENEGTVKTISAPKVTTLDNNTARISQGISIPFSQVSSQGVNTTFVEARLALEVTPHITQDGSILMAIKAENNQPDPANTGANGQPAIQRKEAATQVLVKDGDTTVIGGIYVRRGATTDSLVPFFGKIPLIGVLFKRTSERDERQELLIFITPRIVNRQTVAQSL